MSSHHREPRENLKASSATAQRRAMTERRHELTGRIRKAKRSHAVALKRRVGSGTTSASTATAAATDMNMQSQNSVSSATVSGSIVQLADHYVQQPAGSLEEVQALAALHTALASGEADASSQEMESLLTPSISVPGDNKASSPALLLANTLARSISVQHNNSDGASLNAARILTNLAVCGSGGDSTSDNFDAATANNYYGNVQENWCDVLVQSQAVRALVDIVIAFEQGLALGYVSAGAASISSSTIALCEQCCWALGNIAGDSQRSRDALRTAGAIRPLLCTLRLGLNSVAAETHTAFSPSSIVGLCRNAAWALSNLCRGSYTSALPFLKVEGSGEDGLLTATDLRQILSVHRLATLHDSNNIEPTTTSTSTWMDVATECSWLLTLLTSKEDEAVDFIFSGTRENSEAFCISLSYALEKASHAASNKNSDIANLALRTCVPLIRTVGNVAASCGGRYVPYLLLYSGTESVKVSLTRIVQLGSSRGKDYAVVATEACWAGGTLLVDAGTVGHPSTQSCDVFVPTFCHVLTSASAKIELKREAASALCNAIAAPPLPSPTHQMASAPEDSPATRDQILKDIVLTDGVIASLTALLTCFDTDAVFAALTLVNSILHRIVHAVDVGAVIKTRFEEADIVDALETICDRASAASSYGTSDKWHSNGCVQEKSAEIAADLIDDFFDNDNDYGDDCFDDAPRKDATSDTFAFGLANGQAPQTFNVGQPAVDLAQPPDTATSTPMGRGRGRGQQQVMPAWMSQQQQN